jgi:dodecin
MANHVYRVTEIVGSSPDGSQAAIENGIRRAALTVRNIEWFEVTEIRGDVADGEIAHWQVAMKLGFRVDEPEQA